MGISITISEGASDRELDAVNALISVLRDRNDYVSLRNDNNGRTDGNHNSAVVHRSPAAATLPGVSVPPPLSSTASGEASPASISVTVPPVPAPPAADPVPLPVPPAPVAVVPPPPVSNGADPVSLDAEGLPWDERIHSSSKNRTAKDVWARRRNTPDETWEAVRAVLKQAMGAPTPMEVLAATPVEQLPHPPAATLVPPDAAQAFAVPPTPPASVPVPPAPVPTVSAPPVAIAAADDPFSALLVRITGEQSAGRLSVDQVQAAATAAGLTSIRDLMVRPDLVPVVSAALFGAVA